MSKKLIIIGTILGFTSIILGAFGAHALKAVLTPENLAVFETGVRYQMYHALFLIGVAAIPFISDTLKKRIKNVVLLGVILFSGSIYLLATNALTTFFDFKSIGFITPIGGLLLIIAWLMLLVKILKIKD